MKKNTDRLALLNQRLAHVPEPMARWETDDGRHLAPGQVWAVAGGCGEQPTWLWLVLECLDNGLANGVPLFRWGELAGPRDVYVPKEWAGTTLIASFELEHTLDRSALGECLGRLPEAAWRHVTAARADVADPVRRQAYAWGIGYLDAVDRRLAYHDAVGTVIETLQASVRATVFSTAAAPDQPVASLASLLRVAFSPFRSAFEPFPALAAAGSGEEYSPCLVTRLEKGAPEQGDIVVSAKHWALSRDFDALVPGSAGPVCCEWLLKETVFDAVGAVVYAPGVEYPIGNAMVYPREHETLVILDHVEMPATAQAVTDPASLRLVILVRP